MTNKLQTIPASFENSDNVTERLVFAVNQQMSNSLCDYASDISNYGIQGGFSGFTYYADTCAFYQANKEDIWELATDQADENYGKDSNVFTMLANFGGAKNVSSAMTFENLMAWYAAEEAARYVSEFEVEEEDDETEEED